jgi:hypothetical protein
MRRAYPAGSQEVLGLCLSAAMPSSATSFLALNHQQHHHLASTVDSDTPTERSNRSASVGAAESLEGTASSTGMHSKVWITKQKFAVDN